MADKPRITADELAQRLVNSRKVMKKVNTGDYETGNIDETKLLMGDDIIEEGERPVQSNTRPVARPTGNVDPNRVNQTRLPDAIKKAMIENPIPVPNEISMNDTLDINFINKARQLMEQDGSLPTKKIPTTNSKNQRTSSQINEQEFQQIPTYEIPNNLETIIENCIRKVFDEKLSQILNAQEAVSINENLVIKVGDSLFSGKITKVKSSK